MVFSTYSGLCCLDVTLTRGSNKTKDCVEEERIFEKSTIFFWVFSLPNQHLRFETQKHWLNFQTFECRPLHNDETTAKSFLSTKNEQCATKKHYFSIFQPFPLFVQFLFHLKQ